MALPPAKHDALFRLIVADPGRASALLQDYLPPDIVALLDLDSPPEHVEGAAIDGEGSKTQADAIFRVRPRDGSDARVYVLLEHKSTVDAGTPLYLMRYMLEFWTAEIDRGDAVEDKLSPIIPMVFYHGRERWTLPLSIQEMIQAPEDQQQRFGQYAVHELGYGQWPLPLSIQEMIRVPEGMEDLRQRFGHYAVHELAQIAPARLCRDRVARSSLFALAHDGIAALTEAEEELLAAGIVDTELGRYHLKYIAVRFDLSLERLYAARRRAGEDPQEMEALVGTIAETWLAEGEARGKAAGIAEGKADAFLRVARRKFHTVPEDRVRQVRGASTETLDAWLEALITAADIDAVFTDRNGH